MLNRENRWPSGARRVNQLMALPMSRWQNQIPPAVRPYPPALRSAIKSSPPEANPQQGYADFYHRTPESTAMPTLTGFRYPKIVHLGWAEDDVPIKLQVYPGNIHVVMKQKTLVKNRVYTVGRDASCDISFVDADTIPELQRISGLHLKLKVISFRASIC
jgi:hypothetical protein